ncbi:MAG: hypothetical protein KDA72_07185 [Planctomycetales bacterium]|nr:hypothetical protein [Planctomycetales bacterium]
MADNRMRLRCGQRYYEFRTGQAVDVRNTIERSANMNAPLSTAGGALGQLFCCRRSLTPQQQQPRGSRRYPETWQRKQNQHDA